MDQRTRKLMTMHKALDPRYGTDYFCQEKENKKSPVLKIASINR